MATRAVPARQVAKIIPLSLLMGVLLFAGLTAFWRLNGEIADANGDDVRNVRMLRYAVWGLSVVSIMVATLLKARLAGLTRERQSPRLMIGWMVGEATGLLAVIQAFMGGSLQTMCIGILAFVVVLVILRPSGPST